MLTSELASVWVASDGKKFLSEKEAKVHEAQLSIKEQIYDLSQIKEDHINLLNKSIKEKIEWLQKQQQNLK